MNHVQEFVAKEIDAQTGLPFFDLVQKALAGGIGWGTLIQVILALPWPAIVKWVEDFLAGLNPPVPQPPKA